MRSSISLPSAAILNENIKSQLSVLNFPDRLRIYVASIVHDWQDESDLRLKKLEEYLELLGLTRKVGAKSVDDTQVEILVGRLPVNSTENSNGNEMVSIADVGFGISQTLPVMVALLAAKPGQLVYIEQPEIHLHPRAQTAMAQILADMADRGVKVVVETHSSLLLLGIQSLVAEGSSLPNASNFTGSRGGRRTASQKSSSADLDDAGAFGDWPEDFSSAEMDADTRYIHAAEARSGVELMSSPPNQSAWSSMHQLPHHLESEAEEVKCARASSGS